MRDLNCVMLGQGLNTILGFDIEPNDLRCPSARFLHIALTDWPDFRSNDIQSDFIAVDFREGILDRLHRSINIPFDDETQGLLLVAAIAAKSFSCEVGIRSSWSAF